jgi:2-methylcitrate dehydratase PrpD
MTKMLSAELADFIVFLEYERLSPEVKSMTIDCLVDWMGSALRGSVEPPAMAVEKIVADQGGAEQAGYIGWGKKGPSLAAALLNGVSSHTVEMDDLHRGSILHPAAPVISAALAAAEKEGVSGKKLLEGIVAGYEVGIRIGEAVTPAHYYYWHNTATCGTFGAAAAAGKILGLSAEELVDALGSAGTQAAGLWEFHVDGAMSKHLHAGKAAQNGLLSAYLAQQGFTAARRILEGDKGFFKAYASEFDAGKAVKSLGREFKILENSFKLYASCRHTHGGVDLILELKKEGIEPSDVDSVCYKTYSSAVDLVAGKQPVTPFQAKFSLPYCGAAALVLGSLGLDEFKPEYLQSPEIVRLMNNSWVELNDWAEAGYPGQWRTRVECKLKNGAVISRQTENPRGDPENPPAAGELDEKFMLLASACLVPDEARLLLARMKNIAASPTVGSLLEGV